jgi:nonsense-mediated mRNA decay protein 3
VQLRQKRDDSARRGLLILELAIARNAEIRKDILSVQTKRNGFDFYFPTADKARHFVQYLNRAAPMRTRTTQAIVSEDVKNNTANVRTTIVCDMVPLCRDDLIVVQRRAKGVGNLSGRLCLVLKMSSAVHLVDASPARDSDMNAICTDLHAESYWKGGEDKTYRAFLSSKRLVRFVVLNVERCCDDDRGRCRADEHKQWKLYQGPKTGVNKYALADVEVARESDFGTNDVTFQCVTHLGHLLQVGDIVLGYDITSTVLPSEAEENAFNSTFVMPDVVLVRKVKGAGATKELFPPGSTNSVSVKEDEINLKGKTKAKSSASKKRERRMMKEEQKQRRLEEAAARMGLNTDKDVHLELDDFEVGNGEAQRAEFEEQIEIDEDLAEDLDIVERELAFGMENLVTDEACTEAEV